MRQTSWTGGYAVSYGLLYIGDMKRMRLIVSIGTGFMLREINWQPFLPLSANIAICPLHYSLFPLCGR
jgi:hypothetical protein